MASLVTNRGSYLLANKAAAGSISWPADTLKIMLLKSSLTPDRDDNFISDISADECDAGGYVGGFGGAGRKTLANKTVTEDDTNDRTTYDADNPSAWTLDAGNTLRYCAIVQEVTTDADSPVLAVLDFGSNVLTNGGNITVEFDAAGVIYLSTV